MLEIIAYECPDIISFPLKLRFVATYNFYVVNYSDAIEQNIFNLTKNSQMCRCGETVHKSADKCVFAICYFAVEIQKPRDREKVISIQIGEYVWEFDSTSG